MAGTTHPPRSSTPHVYPRAAVAGPNARQNDSGRPEPIKSWGRKSEVLALAALERGLCPRIRAVERDALGQDGDLQRAMAHR